MKLATAILLTFTASAWGAYQSIQVSSATALTMTVPSSAPFTSISDNRYEFRISSWTAPVSGFDQDTSLTNMRIVIWPDSWICVGFLQSDTFGRDNLACVNALGHADITIRAQRFGTTYPSETVGAISGQVLVEAIDNATQAVLANGCSDGGVNPGIGCPISVAAGPFNASGSGTLGGLGHNFQLAWLKWDSTTVAPGTPITTVDSTPADLADFRFEGGCTNSAATSVTLAGAQCSATFPATPVHNPICQLQRQYFRVGQLSLLGNYSYPLDGGSTLGYSWSKLTGGTVTWSSQSIAQPWIVLPTFGSYTLQLVVTDGSSNSTTCSIKDGAVQADANGVVDTGNPQINSILGPLVMAGSHPWSWFDDRDIREGALQIPNLAAYFGGTSGQFWNIQGGTSHAGTVTVTQHSTAVVGIGSTFLADFCGSSPGAATNGAILTVWYTLAAVPGGTGRRGMAVASCADDTHLTLVSPWNDAGNLSISTPATFAYSVDNTTLNNVWLFNSEPANFYDTVLAFYSLYYRTGIDDYQTAARTLADNFWVQRHDSGRNSYYGEGRQTFPRNVSALGMVLRAIDGRSDMWSGLDILFDFSRQYLLSLLPWTQNAAPDDPRETGYNIAVIGYCALYESTNPTLQASCRTALNSIVTTGITPSLDVPTGNSGITLYWNGQEGNAGPFSSWETTTSVTLTPGSATVTCAGCSWSSGLFSAATPWLFCTATTKPVNANDCDTVAYLPTFVNATTLTLDRVYAGSGSNHGWMMGNAVGAVGFGTQPYMIGIWTMGMDWAQKALTCASAGVPTNCNNTNAATLRTYIGTAANYLKNSGYNATLGGMHYFATFPNCASFPAASTICEGGNSASQSRELSPEAMRGVIAGYAVTGDPALRAFGDTLMTKCYGKPGFSVPLGQTSDGMFSLDYQETFGSFIISAPPAGTAHKWMGFLSGISQNAAWPGYRSGRSTGSVISGTVSGTAH